MPLAASFASGYRCFCGCRCRSFNSSSSSSSERRSLVELIVSSGHRHAAGWTDERTDGRADATYTRTHAHTDRQAGRQAGKPASRPRTNRGAGIIVRSYNVFHQRITDHPRPGSLLAPFSICSGEEKALPEFSHKTTHDHTRVYSLIESLVDSLTHSLARSLAQSTTFSLTRKQKLIEIVLTM